MFEHELDWEEALDSAVKSLRAGDLGRWEIELIRTRVHNKLSAMEREFSKREVTDG